LVLVIYASCYPWASWRSTGLAPWAYLFEGLPRYWTTFDLITNIVGYVPLGALIVFALYPRVAGAVVVLCAVTAGVMLALLLECIQSYLPSRVPSILDLITNAAGVLMGALAGQRLSAPVLRQSRLRALKSDWFGARSSAGLIVVVLWPLAQIYPQPYLFGHGLWLPTLSTMLTDWLDTPVDIGKLLWRDFSLDIEHFLLAEIVVTALGMTAAVLTLLCQTRRQAPRLLLALGLAASAAGVGLATRRHHHQGIGTRGFVFTVGCIRLADTLCSKRISGGCGDAGRIIICAGRGAASCSDCRFDDLPVAIECATFESVFFVDAERMGAR